MNPTLVNGKHYLQYGGIGNGDEGWLTFHGYGGHQWRIMMKP